MYLLKYTSIFIPLPRNKHHQISGCPIGDLCSKFSGRMPKSRAQHHPLAYRGDIYFGDVSRILAAENVECILLYTRLIKWRFKRCYCILDLISKPSGFLPVIKLHNHPTQGSCLHFRWLLMFQSK